ncbi:MAG TPA: glucosamine-6-phosphate deaminase [Planctomycetota bacterium]|nr:glucosamine-6-phosphate deaminase [Planctomycetota bacterium]
MQVHRYKTFAATSFAVARAIADLVEAKPQLAIGLPTGNSPLAVYRLWADWQREGKVDFRSIRGFGLDEYLGIPASHPASFANFLKQQVTIPLGLDPGQVEVLDGMAPDPAQACLDWEAKLAEMGGLDVVLLGLGTNGHIAFNEPGSPRDSRTRVAELTPETRRANAPAFGGDEKAVPTKCLTMGIASLLEAREVFLLALGSAKAPAVAAMLLGLAGPHVPASFLQAHPQTQVFLDPTAAVLVG